MKKTPHSWAKRLFVRVIRHTRTFVVAAAVLSAIPSTAHASNALLAQENIDLTTEEITKTVGIKTLFKSKDKNHYYYLPSTIKFMKDKNGEPMWTLMKYNLAYAADEIYDETGNQVLDGGGQVQQGGLFSATFDFGLALDDIDKIKQHPLFPPGATLGRLPLESASIQLEFLDPEKKSSMVKIGPIRAPLTDDIAQIAFPLSRSATDILGPVVSSPEGVSNALFTVSLSFTYKGYDVPYSVKVTGNWDGVSKVVDQKVEAEGGWGPFKSKASYEDMKQSMKESGNITVTKTGDTSGLNTDQLESKVLDKLMEKVFDSSSIQPLASDQLSDEEKGNMLSDMADSARGFFGFSGSAGYKMKKTERKRSGDFTLNYSGQDRITRPDTRFANLDFSYAEENKARHYREVTAGDWRNATPEVLISKNLAPILQGPYGVSGAFGGKVARPAVRSITPGTNYRIGPFAMKDPDNDTVRWAFQATFNSDLSSGVANKLALSEKDPTAIASWNAVSEIYNSIYPGMVLLTRSARYGSLPTLTISEGYMPFATRTSAITIEVDGDDDKWDFSRVRVGSIVLKSSVTGVFPKYENNNPVTDADGNYQMESGPRTIVKSIEIPSFMANDIFFSHTTPSIAIVESRQKEIDVKYTVNFKVQARGKTDKRARFTQEFTEDWKPGESLSVFLD